MEDLPTGEERVASWEANTLHLSESKEVSRLGEGLTMHSLLEGKPKVLEKCRKEIGLY